ncbi:S8 family serine peptidase [Nocardioides cynanchi]|uniref:S8 family serine peptidase n=1 Tax=Nocardioides cynanchi TaxID=2558918 RepID=UPI00177B2EDD|nr:S8 family serine peptidase [Nocardioides cynanchi]
MTWRPAALAVLLGAIPTAVVGASTAAATAAGVGDCTQTTDTVVAQLSHQASRPLDQLAIPRAQALVSRPGHAPGAGVGVAVLDGGISAGNAIPVRASYSVHGGAVHVVDYHGTAVAGLVAAAQRPGGLPTGIAPGAEIVDVQVYGWPVGSTGTGAAISTEHLVTGLDWLAAHARSLHVRVAVVALAVTPTADLAAAVRAVQARGVLVVAAAGNRPTEQGAGYLSEFATARPGQDGRSQIGPALEPGVLTAGTTAAGNALALDPASIPNSAVDVVVPTAGAISVALNGGSCVLTAPATSWAAGEVGGIAALLVDRYAGESPTQIAARLVDTASGTTPDDPTAGDAGSGDVSRFFGAGVVQPLDALTRPLTPGPDGSFPTLKAVPDRTPPAQAPLPRADLLHHSRHLALWAGLLGAGLVVGASVLRPLLSRSRSR